MRPNVNVEKIIQCQTTKALDPQSPCSSGTGKVKGEVNSPIKEVRNSVSVSAENPPSLKKSEDGDSRNNRQIKDKATEPYQGFVVHLSINGKIFSQPIPGAC